MIISTPLVQADGGTSQEVTGAILIAGARLGWLSDVLGFIAVVLATLNVVGGFVVTDRMLGMFRKAPVRDAAPGDEPVGAGR